MQFLIFGIFYPCLAGLDDDRQSLYLNLSALAFLAFITCLLVKRMGEKILRAAAGGASDSLMRLTSNKNTQPPALPAAGSAADWALQIRRNPI